MYLSSVESLQGEKIPFQCPHPMEVPGSPFHCAEFGQHGVGGGNVCFFFKVAKKIERLHIYRERGRTPNHSEGSALIPCWLGSGLCHCENACLGWACQ